MVYGGDFSMEVKFKLRLNGWEKSTHMIGQEKSTFEGSEMGEFGVWLVQWVQGLEK